MLTLLLGKVLGEKYAEHRVARKEKLEAAKANPETADSVEDTGFIGGIVGGVKDAASAVADVASDTVDLVTGGDDDEKEEVLAGGDTVEGSVSEAAPTPEVAEPVEEVVEAIEPVDVAALLQAKADAHAEDLDWKKSIVDILKLLELDSSYGARKELALELGYSQEDIDSKGSAEMNMWLHKQVLRALAENGGAVPAEFLD